MKGKLFLIGIFGGITTFAIGIPLYNCYLLPGIRHKEIMNKMDSLDKRLKKLEK
jgi:hypothetical protein